MTPNIEVNRLYGTDPPDGMTDLSALALVQFEFFAHLNDEKLPALYEYSRGRPASVIYAARDGDGIIVAGTQMKFVGDIVKIINGNMSPANAA